MTKYKTAIFDADGVVIIPQKVFSKHYAEKFGLDSDFQSFFTGEFSEAITGKADLKDLIKKHHDVWKWDKDPQELMDMWFDYEKHTDPRVLSLIAQLSSQDIAVYMATNQEQYRATYLKEQLFSGIFKGFFVSSDLGYEKKDVRFWEPVLKRLAIDIPNIKPEEIIFFDDSQDCIDGALQAGIEAVLYTDPRQIKSALDL